ncbi:Crp/Fnr family transcriptional regulator [Rhizosphaericola mali]|uniref:Crp/Fnr family transcriptional regulator n=1 Tax=Rhizosphaericola mali TaxID=2545455 RepID=A0A5P2G7J2_9BACT|nr:Crp/Fnr family transcriptional regulator [Rhizosphaericola mali]QES90249.1 Crp/Fnr family transcriptional regulator [Rhizosphaericola mali]
MVEFFINYLKDKIDLSEEEVQIIVSVCKQKKLRKKQFLCQEGEIWHYNAFICRGLVKTFSISENGIEHIINFAPENYWTGDRESLLNGTPTHLNIDAIEPTEVILIEKLDFEKICTQIPQLNQLVNKIIQKSFIVAQSRILANISFTAEEKYQNFLQKYPHIVNRIPQHMIAAFIGVTPETLTRLRRSTLHK